LVLLKSQALAHECAVWSTNGGANSAYAFPIMTAPVAGNPNNPVNGIVAYRPNVALPYVIQTNLSLQQQTGANTISLVYVGISRRQQSFLSGAIDINAPDPGNSATQQPRLTIRS
jgi:hypothetical protein